MTEKLEKLREKLTKRKLQAKKLKRKISAKQLKQTKKNSKAFYENLYADNALPLSKEFKGFPQNNTQYELDQLQDELNKTERRFKVLQAAIGPRNHTEDELDILHDYKNKIYQLNLQIKALQDE